MGNFKGEGENALRHGKTGESGYRFGEDRGAEF